MELKEIVEQVFLQAYQMGKQDALEGIHFNPRELFMHYIRDNKGLFEVGDVQGLMTAAPLNKSIAGTISKCHNQL